MRLKASTQNILIILALIISIVALVVSIKPTIIGKVITEGDIFYDSGDVGIGTANPRYQLDVDGDARFRDNLIVEGNLSMGNYLGVGTNEPIRPLHVKTADPDMTLEDDLSDGKHNIALYFRENGIDKARIEWMHESLTGPNEVYKNDLRFIADEKRTGIGDILFWVGQSPYVKMIIKNDGKVGIGTDSPNSILSFGETDALITMDTVDGSDTKSLRLCGGGAASVTRGARILLFGNDYATSGRKGKLEIYSGNAGDANPGDSDISFQAGTFQNALYIEGNSGKVSIANLAGTGTRNVCVNDDGTLIVCS